MGNTMAQTVTELHPTIHSTEVVTIDQRTDEE